MIFDAFPDIKKAYELKEDYILFNRTCTLENAESELEKQIEAFKDCDIKEYKAFASMLVSWKKEIVNSFIIGGSIHVIEKNKLFDNTYDYEYVNKQLEELSKSILSLHNKD